jgi:hypothetical protein
MTRAGRPVITDDQSEIVRGTFTRIESGVKDPAPRVSSVFVLKPDYSSTFASDLRLFKIPWHVTTVASEADAFFEPEGPGISFRGQTPDGRITRHTRYWIVGGQLFEVRAPNIRLVFFEVKPPAVGTDFSSAAALHATEVALDTAKAGFYRKLSKRVREPAAPN